MTVQSFTRLFNTVLTVGLLSVMSAGCAQNYGLVMKSDLAPTRDGVISQKLTSSGYQKAILIPPAGTPIGQNEPLVSAFQKEFLEAGLTLISSASVEVATSQQDIDEVIARSKASGADMAVVLQTFEWSETEEPSRFFVLESPNSETFREVDAATYRITPGLKYVFNSPVLRFTGKIVSVENLEVLGTFNAQIAANWSLPQQYEAQLQRTDDPEKPLEIVSQNFNYDDDVWLEAAKKVCEQKIYDEVSGAFSRVAEAPEETPAEQPAEGPPTGTTETPAEQPTETTPTSETDAPTPSEQPPATGEQ